MYVVTIIRHTQIVEDEVYKSVIKKIKNTAFVLIIENEKVKNQC